MRGRKPLPTSTKRLNGNPGKRRLPAEGEEPDYEVAEVIEPPEYLGVHGVREWKRIGPRLAAMQLLTEADLAVFEAYCLNYQLLVEARLDIQENGFMIPGSKGDIRNPALSAFSSATTAIRSLASEFGLTPSSRSRMLLPGDEEESIEDIMADDGEDDVR